MVQIEQPMLSGKVQDIHKLTYPVMVSPKLDGIRCVIVNGRALSRNFKPIANLFIRKWLETYLSKMDGLDGELMVRGADFADVSSGVMRSSGEPDFYYNVFDWLRDDPTEPFHQRYDYLKDIVDNLSLNEPWKGRLVLVPHYVVMNPEELTAYEEKFLAAGYEGIMVRDIMGPYKFGRSSDEEGYLLKLKRFVDSEAVVLSIEPQMRNDNEATEDALGRSKRSKVQSGLVATDKLGSFHVRDLTSGIEFDVGTGKGLTEERRKQFWRDRAHLIGKTIKYKSQPHGAKDAPRFPIWIGFRDPRDMDPVKKNPAGKVYVLRRP
jgi:DNA ligase-1